MSQSPTPKAPDKPAPAPAHAISPDELMSDFRGHSLVKIMVFTLVLHVLVFALFSPGYLKRLVFGESPEPSEPIADLTDQQRMDKAQKEGDSVLREIADRYGLTLTQLKAQLASEKARASIDPAKTAEQVPPSTDKPDPASPIERDITIQIDGPVVPDLSADDEEDLFAPGTPR